MSTDERHNGWANRETWAVSLYLNNDQTWQEGCQEAVQLYAGESLSPWEAGDAVLEYVEDLAYSVSEGTADRTTRLAVLDMGSLWRVDWREIGASFLEDVS